MMAISRSGSGSQRVTLLLMPGGAPSQGDAIEQAIVGARYAVTADLLERASRIGLIDQAIVAAPSLEWLERLGMEAPFIFEPLMEEEGEEFHFGRALQAIVRKHKIERLIYFSGGSGALLPEEELASLVRGLHEHEHESEGPLFLCNNFYSVDFFALAPARALLELPPPRRDNELGWLLAEAGLPARELPRSAATQFDVDAPMDLLLLKLHPECGPHTRAYLGRLPQEELDLDPTPLERAMGCLTDREATVLVAGRIPAYVVRHLEEEAACQTRIFSEERGMKAGGREERGEVRSLLGLYLEEVGPRRFFKMLGELADLAVIDSRVLFAHLGRRPSAPDRYWSDLLQPERIADPLIREFTAAAREAPIAVLLGGHSLVSGGLFALVELAWMRKDLPRRVHLHRET